MPNPCLTVETRSEKWQVQPGHQPQVDTDGPANVVQQTEEERRWQERQAAAEMEAVRAAGGEDMRRQSEAHCRLCADIEERVARDAAAAAAIAAAAATAQQVKEDGDATTDAACKSEEAP